MPLPIPIVVGALAIVLGNVALSVKKGRTMDRGSGMLFVCAMLVMGTTASILEFLNVMLWLLIRGVGRSSAS